MRHGGDCCHYDDGYDDGFDDGKKALGVAADLSLGDLIYEWAQQQNDPALAEAGFRVAASAGIGDIEHLAACAEKRRIRLLQEYAAAVRA